jgi:hypothetical protein
MFAKVTKLSQQGYNILGCFSDSVSSSDWLLRVMIVGGPLWPGGVEFDARAIGWLVVSSRLVRTRFVGGRRIIGILLEGLGVLVPRRIVLRSVIHEGLCSRVVRRSVLAALELLSRFEEAGRGVTEEA